MRRTPRYVPVIRRLSQVRRLVSDFESGCLRPAHRNHRVRLILGLWYVINPCPAGPLEAMRRGLAAHAARHPGSPAYDERTTAFYLQRIEAFAAAAPASLGLIELISSLLASELANPRLHLAPICLPPALSGLHKPVCRERTLPGIPSREVSAAAFAA